MRYLILIFGFLGPHVFANTPEEAVKEYLHRVKTDGLSVVSQLTHPEELLRFQALAGPVVEIALTKAEGRQVFSIFSDAADPSKVRVLSPADFIKTFYEWAESAQPAFAQAYRQATFEVLGHIKENDVSHVIVRSRVTMQGLEIEKMNVMSTRDYQGRAMLTLAGDIKQMAETLRRTLATSK